MFSYTHTHLIIVLLVVLACGGASALGQEPDRPAKLLTAPEFVLPDDVAAAGIDGTLRVSLSINKSGFVKDASINSTPLLARATIWEILRERMIRKGFYHSPGLEQR